MPSAYHSSSIPRARARLLLAEQRRGDPARRRRPARAARAAGSGSPRRRTAGTSPARRRRARRRRTGGRRRTGPRARSARERRRGPRRSCAIRRSIASSGVPSPRRSARHAAAIAPSSRRLAAGDQSAMNDHGRVWCGAGAVQAARTASSTTSRATSPAPNERIVRRARDRQERRLRGTGPPRAGGRGRRPAPAGGVPARRRGPAPPGRGRPCPSPARSPRPPRRRAPRPWPRARARGGRPCRAGRRAPAAPRMPIATLTRPSPPWAAERVRDHDARARAPSRSRRASREALGRGVRVLGEQRQEPGLHVRRVDAGVRADEAVACLGDHEVAAPGDDPRRLPLDPRRAAVALGRPRGPRPSTRPSGSRRRRRRRGRRARRGPGARSAARSSPGRTSGRPSTGRTSTRGRLTRPASSATRARASARASSVMIVSVTPHADARRLDPRDERAVALVDHPGAEQAPVGLGRAGGGDLDPGDRHQPVGHPGERRAADDAADPDHADRGGARPPPGPRAPRGSGRSRRPGSTGRRPRRRPSRDRLEHARRRPRTLGALVPDGLHLVARAAPNPVLLEMQVELAARRPRRRSGSSPGRRVIGSSRAATPKRAAISAGHLGERRARTRAGSCGTGGSRGRGRRG